ncbi:Putative Co/Zn/Cd efflux system membrane fusion protein [Fulvivirga imtechensis AK7]|uniref:Putative Co/Zn/Cd efflux system membrane fusion protein n=1 Tax=Fulvivirga imtechensis AK7 TaxID=1237149 RepID=L8JYG4_9BACT|nr:efflux RND transporter periplasmic adaptor subunit [Fulvivirga imtechensis]ELR73815.1 Putative Co/Zn/Cd efflux system membrane fusion protein [Fulvivirga imtechensis AK7]
MSSTVKKVLIGIIVIIAVGFIVYPQFKVEKNEASGTGTVSSGPERLPVSAIVVKQNILDNKLRSTGSLMANEYVTLKSEVSGIVERINFKEGQRVKKGQLLVQLNDDEIRAEIEKLQFSKKLNEDIEFRQKQLLEKEAISKEEYETVLTTLNTTMADIKVRQVQLVKHQIRAPFDGIIGLRSVSEGSYLNPSDNIVTLYSINPIKVDFSVPGKYSGEVNAGDKIEFTTDAFKDVFTGEIYAIEPQIDPKTRSLLIRAVSANKENKLLPGQFVKIQLTLDTYENAIMIPTEAVIPELNSKKVFVYKNGVAESTEIETGIRTADRIQVTSGLSAGDTVITSGTLQLRQGTAVAIEIQDNE